MGEWVLSIFLLIILLIAYMWNFQIQRFSIFFCKLQITIYGTLLESRVIKRHVVNLPAKNTNGW
jgi:hypothetical protein